MIDRTFLSLLSLDSYNRGYDQILFPQVGDDPNGQDETQRRIGIATIFEQAQSEAAVEAGFYAIAYRLGDQTIISYRGTSFDGLPASNDVANGWSLGAGFSNASQGDLAIEFYRSVTEQSGATFSSDASNTILTGHSLGGGLAGLFPVSVYETN